MSSETLNIQLEGAMKKQWVILQRTLAIAMIVLLSTMYGCGRSGGGSDVPSTSAHYSTLAMAKTVEATEDCPNGGIEVDSGIDANGNGVLDESEIQSRQSVCNGENGTSTLVAMVEEPVGDYCSDGGVRVNAGNDTNTDGILQDSEITTHDFICNGENGDSGSNGHNALVQIVPVSDGLRISSGMDVNDNGVLDENEIQMTQVVTNGEPGPGITWESVTNSPVQAQSNTGYIANSDSRVTITLPTDPALGDIIEINGAGSGGWKIAQNAGQRIITKNIRGYREWEPRDVSRQWSTLTSWNAGASMAATDFLGNVYLSSDYGHTWGAQQGTVKIGSGENEIAAMENGSALAVAVLGGGLYTYSFSNDLWTKEVIDNSGCTSVAYASKAGHLIYTIGGKNIYVRLPENGPSNTYVSNVTGQWTDIAASSDGTLIVAAARNNTLFISTDEGQTWSARDSIRNWNHVTISADGKKLAATVENGKIYTSSDYGNTWTERGSNRNWKSIASSADGTCLVAAVYGGKIYTSNNSGVTWAEHDVPLAEGDPLFWNSVAISPDGLQPIALIRGGHIYTSEFTDAIFSSTSGTTGYMTGEQYDVIKLQYIGNNTFSILYNQGNDFVIR
jgi:hypothetical protein